MPGIASQPNNEGGIERAGPPTEADIERALAGGVIVLPPATLALRVLDVSARDAGVDGVLVAEAHGHSQAYAYESKSQSTPKAVEMAVAQAERGARLLGMRPLVVVPYLSEERLAFLEANQVSGLDLCGNGLLLAERFTVHRSGQPNLFPSSAPIKNVFRGQSSLVVRALLLEQNHESLDALWRYIVCGVGNYTPEQDTMHLRSGPRNAPDVASEESELRNRITKGTVSKVVSVLEEQLAVVKRGRAIGVADVDRLLNGLLGSYQPPSGPRVLGKAKPGIAEVMLYGDWHDHVLPGPEQFKYVQTGLASAANYGVLDFPSVQSLYVTDLAQARERVLCEETNLFPDIELIEERDEGTYFGRPSIVYVGGPFYVSSIIQTWLELATSGPREQDAARVLAARIRRGETGLPE